MNELEQETAQDSTEESNTDSLNTNFSNFNKNHSVIKAQLKTSADKTV